LEQIGFLIVLKHTPLGFMRFNLALESLFYLEDALMHMIIHGTSNESIKINLLI